MYILADTPRPLVKYARPAERRTAITWLVVTRRATAAQLHVGYQGMASQFVTDRERMCGSRAAYL